MKIKQTEVIIKYLKGGIMTEAYLEDEMEVNGF